MFNINNMSKEENKAIVKYAKEKTAEAINELNTYQVVLYCLKEYEKYRDFYTSSEEWTIEKISDVLSKCALTKLKLIKHKDGTIIKT